MLHPFVQVPKRKTPPAENALNLLTRERGQPLRPNSGSFRLGFLRLLGVHVAPDIFTGRGCKDPARLLDASRGSTDSLRRDLYSEDAGRDRKICIPIRPVMYLCPGLRASLIVLALQPRAGTCKERIRYHRRFSRSRISLIFGNGDGTVQ